MKSFPFSSGVEILWCHEGGQSDVRCLPSRGNNTRQTFKKKVVHEKLVEIHEPWLILCAFQT